MNDLVSRIHALACEIDDEPAGTFATDDGRDAMCYLVESLEAASRAAELPQLQLRPCTARGS